MFVVLVPFGMGLVTTLANCAAYMLSDAGSLFLLLVMLTTLLAVVSSLRRATDLTAMGDEFTRNVCKKVEQDEAADVEKTRAAGVKLTPLSAADQQALEPIAAQVATEWAQNLDRRGKSGTEVLNAFKAGLNLK